MGEDTIHSQTLAPGRYLSLVLHVWVGDHGELIRGTIEDAHTGKRLANLEARLGLSVVNFVGGPDRP